MSWINLSLSPPKFKYRLPAEKFKNILLKKQILTFHLIYFLSTPDFEFNATIERSSALSPTPWPNSIKEACKWGWTGLCTLKWVWKAEFSRGSSANRIPWLVHATKDPMRFYGQKKITRALCLYFILSCCWSVVRLTHWHCVKPPPFQVPSRNHCARQFPGSVTSAPHFLFKFYFPEHNWNCWACSMLAKLRALPISPPLLLWKPWLSCFLLLSLNISPIITNWTAQMVPQSKQTDIPVPSLSQQ